MSMKRVSRAEAEVYPLPGRDWHSDLGPESIPTKRISFGVSVALRDRIRRPGTAGDRLLLLASGSTGIVREGAGVAP